MDCPKCGREAAAGAVDCANCGIVFARYMRRPTERGEIWVPPAPAPEPKRDSGSGVLVVFVLFVAAAIGAAVYMKKSETKLPPVLEDYMTVVLIGVLVVAAAIYKFMVFRNARL